MISTTQRPRLYVLVIPINHSGTLSNFESRILQTVYNSIYEYCLTNSSMMNQQNFYSLDILRL